ncbi:MAG: penicillin-binding protein 2 [Rhizobiaceae bacterium]|nr:penicillin-binding protein 2 [Rhizobiaceae bacterium]
MIRRYVRWIKGRFERAGDDGNIVVEGARTGSGRARNRLVMTMAVFMAMYAAIGGRLVYLGLQDLPDDGGPAQRNTAARPDIIDRNGEILATDIKTFSLFAEPRRIVDVDEAIEKLVTVLPDLNYEQTYHRLRTDAGFVWLRRQLSPRQQAEIMALGIPGIGFRSENRRFYPGGAIAAHVLGLVDIDNKGIAGIEKYIDQQGLADLREIGLADRASLKPFQLALDIRVQHILHDELTRAMERYQAIASGGVVLNAQTGEVVAMVSLPDYDPNNPVDAHRSDRLNRMSGGVFEMGSTFKGFTTAMALDSGLVTLNDSFDARRPLQVGKFTIRDFHGKGRVLSVPEIFIYSSNIGTARMAETISIEDHRAFFQRIGLLDKLDTELPEVATPTGPEEWKRVNRITISFGHGVATTPLQTAVSAAALVNGGVLFDPTFLPRNTSEAVEHATAVLNPSTSDAMRYLFRLNVEKGSGRRADVPGYFVGGKTGTAEKVVNGRYSTDKRFNAFLSAFPVNNPQYVVLVILDEPKPEQPGMSATSGLNAAPVVSNVVRRSAPLLGVMPEFGHESAALLVSTQ